MCVCAFVRAIDERRCNEMQILLSHSKLAGQIVCVCVQANVIQIYVYTRVRVRT